MNVTGRIRCHRRFGQAEDNSHGTLRRIWKDIYGLPPVKAMVLRRCTQYNADGREDDERDWMNSTSQKIWKGGG